MDRIVFPLKAGMDGAATANLQSALLALLEKKQLLAKQPEVRKEVVAGLQKECAEAVFGTITQRLVKAYQAERKLKQSGNVDEETAATLNAELVKLKLLDDVGPAPEKTGFGGQLVYEHGQVASELRLRLYRRVLGQPPVLLKETVADGEGRYRFDLAGKPAASVELFAVGADGEETRLTRTLTDLPDGDAFDLVAPNLAQADADEFSRLKAALTPHTGGKAEAIKDAVEFGERREYTLLSQTTGWEAGVLALAADAFETEARTGLPAAVLYALARAGLPNDPRVLADVPLEHIDGALREAAEAGIIDEAQVEPGLDAVGRYATEKRLEDPIPGTLSSAKDFAAKARVSAEDKKAFSGVIAEARGEDIWARAKASGVSDAGIKALQLQGKLAYLTFNNAELVEHLESQVAADDDPEALIALGYHESAHWTKTLQKLSGNDEAKLAGLIPPAYTGKTQAERLEAYAAELARRVRQMDPHAVTVERIASGKLAGLSHVEDVARFLKNAAPKGFRLGQTPLGEFCARHGEALWDGISAGKWDAVLDSVRKLTALYTVSLDDTVLEALLRAGYSSATAIARSDYWIFKQRVLGYLPEAYREGDLDVTETVYARAQQQSATVFNVFDGLKRLDTTAPPPAATPGEAARRADQIAVARQKLAGRFPTLEALFGSVDYCNCEHCRSVLSPAAYLVDLLHFIDPDDEAWATVRAAYKARTGADYTHGKPFAVLDKRRPDIKHIALTCENTHTALPYVDVVNEVLEQVMMSGTDIAIEAHDVDELASDDLVAEPQNILWSAYVGTAGMSLREKRYPVSLPFDLPLEMARAFLRQLDLPLWRLRAALARPAGLDPSAAGRTDGWTDVWFERLRLGPVDVAVLTRATDWHELFGYAGENDALATVVENGVTRPAAGSLRNAKTLARRLEIDYATLVEVLRTRFINPHIEHLIALKRLGIDTEKLDRYLEAGTPRMDAAERTEFDAYLAGLGVQKPELAALRTQAVLEATLEIEVPDMGCDFSRMTLAFAREPAAPKPAYARVFHRMNALVRLHKKLGWEIHELDRLLMGLMPGATGVTLAAWPAAMKTALIHFAHVEELRERFEDRLSREEIALYWSDLPAAGWNCLYDRLFPGTGLSGKTVAFRKRLGQVLQDATQRIDDHAEVICEAMQLTHADLAPILAAGGAQNGVLSLANLSILLRHALLARGLDMQVSELLGHIGLSSHSPLALLSGAPVTDLNSDLPWSGTLAFVAEMERAREAQAGLAFLERLCWHRGIEEPADADADPALLALLALPPEQAGQENAQRELVVKTLAAQLSLAVPTADFLLTDVLKDGNNRPLKETGFTDKATSQTSLRRLRRAADLIQTLEITTDELKYLHGLSGALDPGGLATAPVTNAAAAKATRQGLRPWLELAVLRRRFGRSERIIEVFDAARRQAVTTTLTHAMLERRLHEAMMALTGLKLPALADSLKAVGANSNPGAHFEVAALGSAAALMRVLDALKCFQRIGLDPEKIVEFATKPVDDDVARQLHSSLKARYQKSAWRRLVQPIFDGLRKKRRDALVAHLTHVTRSDGTPRFGETPEKLFEFLLLDPGMEPVVLASRIQLAISSVQLFVQRCLMNLEDAVNPQIIDVRRWEWMSRYRVWEVNRKMFIWPENWLDPEFRDDKTHLFRELESKLLQGDVNEDLVRNGFNSYLKGLEEVGRLAMLTMYYEPGISADGAALHVVGRSVNAPHKYFYRKVSHGMWTPWEPLDTGIEGEHLVLTSWRGRMHLFWLSFLEQSQEGSAVPAEFTPSSDKVTTSNLRPGTRVDLQLHWVECVKGRWGNRSSTPGFVDTEFAGEKATTDGEKRKFHVRAVLLERSPGIQDDVLEIHVSKGEKVHKFVFFSKLAPPTSEMSGTKPQTPPYELLGVGDRVSATRWCGDGALRVRFASESSYSSETGSATPGVKPHAILQDGGAFSLLFPSNENLPIPLQYAPAGIGRPSGFALGAGNVRLIAYRATDGEIYCLESGKGGWRLHAPSGEAHEFDLAKELQAAQSDPSGYVLRKRGVVCLAYSGKTCLQELVLEQPQPAARNAELLGTWRVETLFEGKTAKERPVGRPLGGLFEPARGAAFLTADGRLRAVVRTADDRGWKDLILNAGAPKAVAEPCGFVQFKNAVEDAKVQSRHVFYLGDDGHIHELRSDTAGQNWAHENITAHLHGYESPAKDGVPAAYPFRKQNSIHVVYRDSKGRIHELRKAGNGPWSHERIQAQVKMAAGDPSGYATEYATTQHVVFRADDGEVTELWWHQGKWQEVRLAQLVNQPTLATSDIAGLSIEKAATQHLFYLGEDGCPRVLWEKGGWKMNDCRLASPFPDPLGPLAAPFFYEAGEQDHTFFVEPFVLETAVHEWTGWIVTTREYVPAVRRGDTLRPLYPKARLPQTMNDNPAGVLQIDERYRKAISGIAPAVPASRGIVVP